MASLSVKVNVETFLNNEKVDIEEVKRALGQSEPCEWCSNPEIIYSACIMDDYPVDVNFCPNCGRRIKPIIPSQGGVKPCPTYPIK